MNALTMARALAVVPLVSASVSEISDSMIAAMFAKPVAGARIAMGELAVERPGVGFIGAVWLDFIGPDGACLASWIMSPATARAMADHIPADDWGAEAVRQFCPNFRHFADKADQLAAQLQQEKTGLN